MRRSGFPLQHARSVRSLVTRIHLLVVLHVHRTLLLRRLCTIRVVMVLLEDTPLEIRCLQAEWQETVPTQKLTRSAQSLKFVELVGLVPYYLRY